MTILNKTFSYFLDYSPKSLSVPVISSVEANTPTASNRDPNAVRLPQIAARLPQIETRGNPSTDSLTPTPNPFPKEKSIESIPIVIFFQIFF